MNLKPIHSLFLKEFLLNGILFGLIMELWDYFSGDGFSIPGFLFLTIFFGGAMAIWHIHNVEEFIQDLGFDIMSQDEMKEYEEALIQTPDSEEALIQKLAHSNFTNEMSISNHEKGIILKSSRWSWDRLKSIIISKKESGNYIIAPKSRFFLRLSKYYQTVYLIRYIKDKVLLSE